MSTCILVCICMLIFNVYQRLCTHVYVWLYLLCLCVRNYLIVTYLHCIYMYTNAILYICIQLRKNYLCSAAHTLHHYLYLSHCGVKDSDIDKHLSNDWLASCWILLIGNLISCIALFLLTLKALFMLKSLPLFIYGSTLIESLLFLVGSAYFVSGSYPPTSATEELTVPLTREYTADNRGESVSGGGGGMGGGEEGNGKERALSLDLSRSTLLSYSYSSRYELPRPVHKAPPTATTSTAASGPPLSLPQQPLLSDTPNTMETNPVPLP